MANQFHGTYYELLEVSPGTPQHEVTRAYERAKVTYSSENPALYTVFSVEEARELLTLVEEAYLILGNTIFRNRYDEMLKDPTLDIQELKFENIVGPILNTNVDKQKARFRPEYEVDQAMESVIQNETTCDGPFLRKVREYKKMSVEKMSEITRINPHYIVALEKNNWANLPAPVFVRGFVVQICRLLNLDEKKVTESFMMIYKAQTK